LFIGDSNLEGGTAISYVPSQEPSDEEVIHMKSVLKGLSVAVLAVSFGLSMMPKASAQVLTQPYSTLPSSTAGNMDTDVMTQPSVIDNGVLTHPAVIDNSVLTQPAVIDNTVLTQPAVLGSSCGSCNTLVQPAVIDSGCNTCGTLVQPAVFDNGCNTCGGFTGSSILTQPAVFGGYGYGMGSPFYGGLGMRRGLFGGRLFGGGWF
jgi:hypothetical protein